MNPPTTGRLDASTMDLAAIRRAGLEALARELGPVGLVRFLQQFEPGRGDYTADRQQWLPAGDVKSIAAEVRRTGG